MDAPGSVPPSINCHACGTLIDLTGQTGFTHVECPHCSALSIVPVQFGNFLLLSTLGIGGMGTVYKAIDLSLNRYLGLKILRKKLANNPDFIENFTREARSAASINHSNVAQVYSFGEQDGQYYLAMELLERGSLDDRMARVGKLPETDVLEIGIKVALGLRAAHQRGLLHRDIKPGNVLFNEDGVPKLVDFGLARPPTIGPASLRNPPTEPIWGTPYYIAPEKLRGQPEDARSDVYSLGATLYHALAGRPPFDARTADEVAVKHATTPAYSLKTYAPTAHPFTCHVIARMLAKNPAERYNNCDEVIHDLQEAQKFIEQAKSQRTVVSATGERVPVVQVVGTIAAVVACAAVLIFMWVKREKIFGSEQTPQPAGSGTGTNVPAVATNPAPGGLPAPAIIAPDGALVDFNETTPWVKSWNTATLQLAQGRFGDAGLGYESLVKQLGFSRPKHTQWINFYRALALLAENSPGQARSVLVDKAHNPDAAPGIPETVSTTNFIDTLVHVLLDEVTVADLQAAEPRLPVWAAGLAKLTAGFKKLEQGEFAAAAESFRGYVAMKPDEPQRWAFNLQPLADRLARNCKRASELLAEIDQLTQDKKYDDALVRIQQSLGGGKFAALRAQLQQRKTDLTTRLEEGKSKDEEERLRQAAAAARREEEQAARAAQERQRSQEELTRIAAFDKQLTAYWPKYDFKGALAKCDDFKAQLTTAQAKAAFAQEVDLIKLVAEFKAQLSTDFPRQPYDSAGLENRTGARLSGRVVRATDTQLVCATPYGDLVTDWRDLAPATLVKMGEFYLTAFSATEKPDQRAHRYLLLAAFCKKYDLERAAVAYGRQAVLLVPDLQTQLDSLLSKP